MRIKIQNFERCDKLVFSKTVIKNIFRNICAFAVGLNLNLRGPPGIGKTIIC